MMKWKRARTIGLLAALSAGTIFQMGYGGCTQLYTNVALNAVDFCAVFNCESGTFFNFCSPVPLLADCPDTGE